MTSTERDPFEKRLKEELQGYEVPYNSADWAQMERALNSGMKGWSTGRTWAAGAAVAGLLMVAGTAYWLGRGSSQRMSDKEVVAEAPSAGTIGTAPGSFPPSTIAIPAEAPVPVETQVQANTTGAGVPIKETAKASTASGKERSKTSPSGDPVHTKAAVPDRLFHSSVNTACMGEPVDFRVEQMPEDGIYLWNFGDGSFSNKAAPQHTFTKPGSYQVMLSVSGPGKGSMQNKLGSGTITVLGAPQAAFDEMQQDVAGHFPLVRFGNRSHGAETWLWDLGDGTKSTDAAPAHVYKKKGRYTVVLTATNASGCTDLETKEVVIGQDMGLSAVERFRPTEAGAGDHFMPSALTAPGIRFRMSVYNAEGILVYSTNDPNEPWSGKMNNQGPLCEPGTYMWAVDMQTNGEALETITGKVALER
jgi:PKD repeat protein